MKKSIKPILLAISILIVSASVAGCADNEKTTNTSVANTESTSSSGSSSSAEESVISSTTTTTNPYDTSKPIDTITPPVSSSSSSSTNSELENSSSNSEPTSTPSSSSSDRTNSSSNSSSPNSSSSSSTSTTKPTEKPSSSSGNSSSSNSSSNSKPDKITIPEGTAGEYFDVNGNPLPSTFDPNQGGFYDKYGNYHATREEHEEMERQAQEAAKNPGAIWSSMTKEEAEDYWSKWGM